MTEASDAAAAETAAAGEQKQQEQKTFTQAEVDALIKDRAERLAKQQYPDYDELKKKADGAKTLEDRLADVEGRLTAAQQRELRTGIAAEFGISTKKGAKGEPSDADLFLTGTDESTLTAQAQRLAARQADSKKQGNVAPREGETKSTGGSDAAMREFARGLFNTPD